MSEIIATVAENLEKGYMKMIRFESDRILYVFGKKRDVSGAFNSQCNTLEELSAAAGGGKARLLKLNEVTRFRTRTDSKTIDVGFKDAKGRSCTLDIKVADKNQKEAIFNNVGKRLSEFGYGATQKKVSLFGVAWKPGLLMLATLFLGGLLIGSQAGSEGLEIEHEYGGGRSVRRARGMRNLIAGVANLLGFWGCLILTLLVLLSICLYLFVRLKNRPFVYLHSPAQ